MDSKQELALQIAKSEVRRWREEEARAADGITVLRYSALSAIKAAVAAGVPQSRIAEECGWTRQRVNQLVKEA